MRCAFFHSLHSRWLSHGLRQKEDAIVVAADGVAVVQC